MKLRKLSVGLLSLLLLASCSKKQETATEAVVECSVMSVQKGDAALEMTFPATIKGREDIEIRPRIDGFIKDIYVDEGSVVKKGQQLFKIDSPQSEQAVTTALAAVKSAEAQVQTAVVNVDRIRPLAQKGIVSEVQLKTVENAHQSAVAALSQAKASLANAQATLSWTNVTSPVDGVVGTIPLRQGSLVNSSSTLTTVANTSNVYAYFSLNEKDLITFLNNAEGKTQVEKIKNMPPVTLTLADGSVYPEKGKIETISGVVNVTTGSANFRAEFPNKLGILRSGTSGKVSIPRTMPDVFIIPQKTTFALQDKILVYKVQGDSVVQTVISAISTPDGKSYAVTSGLQEGDKIAADGIVLLKHGIKIQEKK